MSILNVQLDDNDYWKQLKKREHFVYSSPSLPSTKGSRD